jgi:hypothetical protein
MMNSTFLSLGIPDLICFLAKKIKQSLAIFTQKKGDYSME